MKKFFSLVLALVMALSLTTLAWGATEMPTAQNGVITLTENVTLSDQWVVTENTTLNLNGYTISNTTDIWNTSTDDWSLISVQGGTLTINGPGTVKAKENDSYAIDVRNASAACIINGGEFIGNCSAVYVKDGTLTVYSGSFAVQQQATNGNGYGEVLNCFDANYTAGTAKVIVNGGIFKGFNPTDAAEPAGDEQSYVASGYEAAAVGANGEFIVGQDIEVDADGNITAGTFADDVSDYLADGLELTADGVVVSEGGAVLGTKYDLVTTDIAQAKTVGVTVNTFSAKSPKDTNKDSLLDQVGNVQYVEFSNMPGRYFVQVASVGKADYTVYHTGTKSVFGYFTEVVSPFYLGNGVAFYDFGESCGQYDDTPVVGAKYFVFQDVLYMADVTELSDVNLKVGSDLVPVIELPDEWVSHIPAFTYDKEFKIVGVKCAECGTPAVIYPNYDSIPKADKKAMNFYGPINTDDYYCWLAGPGAVVDTETETDKTVTSAQTFDAGIAMYVGMSVMAAAGSAVVIGKKKD